MGDRTYVYIDGESHFLRSLDAWRRIHTDAARLDRLRYIGEPDDRMILVEPRAKVFWTQKMVPGAHRTYYCTSATGDDAFFHELKVRLRNFGLEPAVIPERNQQAKQRQNLLNTQFLIEKAKAVDMSLAVRMFEDAISVSGFDVCHLFTSDVDFIPLIEAIRRRGKQVFVHGYRDGLSKQSAFLHQCDLFTDLETMLRTQCELVS